MGKQSLKANPKRQSLPSEKENRLMRRSSSRRSGPGVVNTVARTALIAGTATAVSGSVAAKGQQKQQAQAAQQAAAAQSDAELQEMKRQMESLQAQQVTQAVSPAPAPAGGSDMIAQLQQLGEMKAAGILTDAEFEAAKARVLAG
jgi:hypothetical protein